MMELDLNLKLTLPVSCKHVGHTLATSLGVMICEQHAFIERGYARHMNSVSGLAGKMSHAVKPPGHVRGIAVPEHDRHLQGLSGLAGDVATSIERKNCAL